MSTFDQVNALCQAFTDEWQSQQRSNLGDYIDRIAVDSREMLFRNLLLSEIKLRRKHGEQPSADEYHQQFPEFTSAIRNTFQETSHSGDCGDTGITQTVDFVPPASRLGDYELVREIGRGGMGCVFEAVHVQHRNRVALKTLPLAEGDRLHQFKREFRSLADINHPNLISLYTLEADGSQWFFTMDLIEGTDFLSHVRPSGHLNEDRLRAALMQLVTGVMALHANHIIHRDLKPSNVMVTNDVQVKLLDFGLVFEQDRTGVSISNDRIMGTPQYMAPEQAAGKQVTAATDWYAVGTMLYEALRGWPPFQGPLLKLLQDKQTVDPPPLEDETLPQDLVELCLRLLARDPHERPDALEVAKAVSTEAAVTLLGASSGDFLVGREPHLAALSESFETMRQQQESSTVLISGRSPSSPVVDQN